MNIYEESCPENTSAQHVAGLVLQHIGARPHDRDIVRAVQFPKDDLDNIKLVEMLITQCFPASSLRDATRWAAIEDVVLEVMVRVYLRTCGQSQGVSCFQ